MFSENFEKCIQFTIRAEGGLTVDTGGLTKYGISQKAYPSLDINNLTIEDAKNIYYNNYYHPLFCDKFKYPISLLLFDTAVNMGKRRAVKIFQEACNSMLLTEKLKVDGIIGIKTLAAAQTCQSVHFDMFAHLIVLKREQYYIKLSKRKKYLKYLRGWLNRTIKLRLIIIKHL